MREVFFRFIDDLQRREKMSSADQKIRFFIDLQNKRLEKNGLIYQMKVYERGLLKDVHSLNYKNSHYANALHYNDCGRDLKILKGEKEIYHLDDKEILYQMITDIHGDVPKEETYNCPNCGNVMKISELLNGCPYCGTRYIMDDLFPVTTDYYFLKDYGREKSELKKEIFSYIIPCSIIITAFFLLSGRIFTSLLIGIILGCISGYMIWAFKTLSSLFLDAGRSVGMLADMGSNKKNLKKIREYDPEFSFEYFMSETVSLIKILAFSDDTSSLSIYAGEKTDLFDDVIDIDFSGAVSIEKVKEEGEDLFLETNIYLNTLRYRKGKVRSAREKYRMVLKRKKSVTTKGGFSIARVECQGCGASFDATRTKICPYCSREYDLSDQSWIITKVKRLR